MWVNIPYADPMIYHGMSSNQDYVVSYIMDSHLPAEIITILFRKPTVDKLWTIDVWGVIDALPAMCFYIAAGLFSCLDENCVQVWQLDFGGWTWC